MSGDGSERPGWSGPAFPGPGWSSGPPPGNELHETEVTDWTAEAEPPPVPATDASDQPERDLGDPGPTEPEVAPARMTDRVAEAAEAEAVSEALAQTDEEDRLADDDLPHPATIETYAAVVAEAAPPPVAVPAPSTVPAWATTPGPLPAPGGPPVLATTPDAPAPDAPAPDAPAPDAPAPDAERPLAHPVAVAALATAGEREETPEPADDATAPAEPADLPEDLPELVDQDAPVAAAADLDPEIAPQDPLAEPAPEPELEPVPLAATAIVATHDQALTETPGMSEPPSWSDAPYAPVEPPPASRLGRILPWAGPAIVVFLISLGLDAMTIMPGLGYWDTGEFQALGPVLGIAHPTGYPSYTLLLWLASVGLQPFGEPAFRANLLSALLVSGAAAFTAIAIVQLTRRWWLGIVGGLALAVAPIAWRNALRADPHAFQVFLVGLLLVLLIAWAERERRGSPGAGRWLIAASAAFALAVTNHGLTVALAPGVAVYVLLVQPRILWLRWKTVVACVATLAVLTVAIYAYLPIRSSMDPPLDYAHPASWINTNADGEVTGGFKYLVLGEQFSGKVEIPPIGDWPTVLPDRLADGARVVTTTLQDELGPLVTLLALLGIPLGLWRRPRETIMTGLWFVLTFVVALGYPNADITRYYLAPLLVACVWAALAVDGVIALLRWGFPTLARGPDPIRPEGGTRRLATALIGGLLAIALLLPTLQAVPTRMTDLDASSDTGARRWLDATLAALPEDAVVVSWWSYSTPLWYGTYVEGRRPDLTIIDDRDIVDGDLGNVPTVVATYMAEGTRPVFVIRLDRDLAEIESDWQLEPLEGVPPGEPVYRVVGPVGGG